MMRIQRRRLASLCDVSLFVFQCVDKKCSETINVLGCQTLNWYPPVDIFEKSFRERMPYKTNAREEDVTRKVNTTTHKTE